MVVEDQAWVSFESSGFGAVGVEVSTRRQSKRSTSRSVGGAEPGISDSSSWVPIRPKGSARSSTRSVSEVLPSSTKSSSNFPPRTVRLQKVEVPKPPKASSKPQRVSREDSAKTDSTRSLSSSSSEDRRPSLRESRQEKGAFPTSSRGRSESRTRTQTRGRSSSRVSSKNGRGRSSSRQRPVTEQQKIRARSRSASLSRVTNPALPPQSPSAASSRRRPPSTFRSQSEMRQKIPSRSNSIGPGVRNKNMVVKDDRSVGSDANIGRNISFGRSRVASTGGSVSSDVRKKGLREKLFGDQGIKKTKANILANIAHGRDLRPRVLLAATVYHNAATNLWIATINTNQRGVAKNQALASKYLKAFSFPSEREARESAISNAPPKMVPFKDASNCFVCDAQFALFRRASHCRNCGVCICNNCSTSWPSKSLPDTYNLKKESNLKVCRTCDALNSAFKKSLLKGDYEEAVALYGTGNINLRNPFPPLKGKKDEILYPVHCAAEGGNLDLLRWLVDDHYCPLKVSSRSTSKKSNRNDILIQTSKGRSVLSIAVERLQVEMLRYLIVEQNVSVYELTDLKLSLRALEAALTRLPHNNETPNREISEENQVRWDKARCDFDEISVPSSLGESDCDAGTISSKSLHTKGTKGSSDCIICFDRKIDCVATPCGHQVCCMSCSKNLQTCPVCSCRGEFIKIFRP